ncbi:GmrSD restriction endonuclease domain-containing protein [Nocardiopsis baichengensis]|uniref:GmrSD restriction endonuclease domain-containing protein n=1 Tax=Nocardiopsis baichengensis TaxID=280240 RepID=UPI000349464B|nr:DUF262 domain-containing protein [Nocardiopsis baichengensis]
MAKLSTLLDQIDAGTVLLPEFQRGYVWNRDQVRGLMRSVYRDHPVGGLLLWETSAADVSVRGGLTGTGTHLMLLDGQQRVTSLYGVIRGKPPAFFDGDERSFSDLYFNVDSEAFEFYAPARMSGDDLWVDVTELFNTGLAPFLQKFAAYPEKFNVYVERLNRLHQITEKEFPQEKITGADRTVDEVVEIFNRVNSGGTKLSKGDLALARICAIWPEARSEMRARLDDWYAAGFDFSLDWLLRNATAVATGRAMFSSLETVEAEPFQRALGQSVEYIGAFLDAVSGRLGLDHDRVLMGRYAVPAVSRLLALEGGSFQDARHRDKVLYWYIHTALWGRFSGSTETHLQQDYDALARGGVDGLIANLERWRGGSLDINAYDFEGSTRGSRFYPLLYMLTRATGARDFGSGLELKAEMLGKHSSLQLHHIFPKALLRGNYERGQVNAIANFCFLTQNTNLEIADRAPEEYLAEVEERFPGTLASQWIPTDPELWKVDRYLDFLDARRELLAEAARSFLSELRSGEREGGEALGRVTLVADDGENDPRAVQVRELVDELLRLGCAEPRLDTEIADPVTGRELAVAEAYWPDGLQPGQGDPVVLELDPEQADLQRLRELGYEVFTSPDALLGFVNRRNAEAAGEEGEGPDEADAPSAPETPSAPEDGEAELLKRFDRAMRDVYDRAQKEAGYTATYFLGMLADHGPLETARRLLASPAVSDGFASLWERGRLDLTVEALVCRPEYASLFSETELGRARMRLEQFGYRL